MPRYNSILTPREEAFVEHYYVSKNAEQSAIKAGFSPRNARGNATRILKRPQVQEALKQKLDEAAAEVKSDAKWVRSRLVEEATDYTDKATQSARVKAIELVGRLNGDFELDNKQKAGIFENVPTEVLEQIKEKLRGINGGPAGVAGKPTPGSGRGFTH